MSEYNSSYNCKNDNSSINAAVVYLTNEAIRRGRTPEQNKTSVISKMLNAMIKTISYPMVQSASYLLGYKDWHFPCLTSFHEFRAFQRDALNATPAYDKPSDTFRFFSPNDEDVDPFDAVDEVDVLPPIVLDEDDAMDVFPSPPITNIHRQTMRAVSAVQMYKYRHICLRFWSPFEMTMGFECEKSTSLEYRLQDTKDGEKFSHLRHKPMQRRDPKSSELHPTYACPQPVGQQLLRRPADDAPIEVRNEYGAWALGNFFPCSYYDYCQDEIVDLVKVLLYDAFNDTSFVEGAWWSHLTHWEFLVASDYLGFEMPGILMDLSPNQADVNKEAPAVNDPLPHSPVTDPSSPTPPPQPSPNVYPRIEQDKFARRCLDNIEDQFLARSLMSSDTKKNKILERRVLEAHGQVPNKDNVHSDREEDVSAFT